MPFTPRVQHERLVLAVARWTISRLELQAERDDLAGFLVRWRHEWNVPRWIYLVERDMKLLLDLDSPLATELLCSQLGTAGDGFPANSVIEFEEMFPDFDHLWLERDGEPHFHEFVAGIVAEEPLPAPPVTVLAGRSESKHGPGSSWTFAKIYCPAAEMDLVLRTIAPLVASLSSAGVDRWFFLRYADPLPHIRLRLHCAANASDVLLAVTARLGELLARQTIARYALDTYEPDSQRYGGAEALSFAEVLFDEDSRRVIDMLAHKGLLAWEPRLMESFGFVVAFLRLWFREFGRERWLRANETEARAVRGVKWPHVRKLRDIIAAGAELPPRARAAIAALAVMERNGSLEIASTELCASFLHMHFNRIGIPMQAERNIVAAVWHAWHGVEREALAKRPNAISA